MSPAAGQHGPLRGGGQALALDSSAVDLLQIRGVVIFSATAFVCAESFCTASK